MRTQPRQTAVRKQQGRHNGIRVEDSPPTHGASRAQETAAPTFCSSMPSWASCWRTSSARLRCSGRSVMHVPSVLTSKYSTPLKRVTTDLGRVTWFLTVILASMIHLIQGNKEILP